MPSPFSRRAAAGILLALSVALVGWAGSWESIRGAAAVVKTVRAGFIQKRSVKIIPKPLISKGIFLYQAPNSLRWQYDEPARSVLLSDAGTVKRYTYSGGEFVADSGAKLEPIRIVLDQITSWLNGKFDQSEAFESKLLGGKPAKIELNPKQEAIGKFIERIVITLSEQPGVIDSVEIIEGKGNSILLDFTDIELNAKLAEGAFTDIELPKAK